MDAVSIKIYYFERDSIGILSVNENINNRS